MPLTDFYNKIVALQEFDVAKETCDIINENSEFITKLLKSQLSKGKDGKGENVTLKRRGKVYDFYSDRTVFEKEKRGQNVAWITNQDSGTFYASLYAFASGETFIIDSDVPYFSDIIKQTGQGDVIMELSKENLELFSKEILVPQLQLRFNTIFNGL